MANEVVDQVITILQGVCQNEHLKLLPQLNGETNLRELGIDSLLFIKFVVKLEVEFDVDFDDENMNIDAFSTIQDIVNYIERQVAVENL
ncbi:acyl carrier protein [Tengunoibacter tsumagoiensis]|uniref:Carrier domain-containing protein n=1 Tax=Tengunoibacter tsumagoiensis TaxID=2014871 RepID=A0A402A9T6_9CHLR|nr:acyl carrier protein [Tengunoibacter tsumagoiensis]GCE15715.1 hypothetical protein KTT_55740 [Tengunoibacter tsumagoiensis]